jgi:hypothetical protein
LPCAKFEISTPKSQTNLKLEIARIQTAAAALRICGILNLFEIWGLRFEIRSATVSGDGACYIHIQQINFNQLFPMTDRERWIVYPLLFFALGMAMWNGMEKQAQQQSRDVPLKSPEATFKSADIDSIRCRQFLVLNEKGTPQIVLTTNSQGGVLSLIDAAGKALQLNAPLQLHAIPQHESDNTKDSDEPRSKNSESPPPDSPR